MQDDNEEEVKPATIRITSMMQLGLNVPLPGPGKSIRKYLEIPPAKGEKPGVIETDELDAVTVNRLRYHYEWRPTDPKLIGKKKEELAPDQVVNIGLLKIEIVNGRPKRTRGGDEGDKSGKPGKPTEDTKDKKAA